MKNHLPPTQYQSLPVNEKSNWKEQYQTRVTSAFTSSGFTEWQNGTKEFAFQFIGSHNVFWQLIYIPIDPESVLNAERGTPFDNLPLNEKAERYTIYNSNEWPIAKAAFIAGHSQGKKGRNKEVIDILEAEIDKNNIGPHTFEILTNLITKLKEIK